MSGASAYKRITPLVSTVGFSFKYFKNPWSLVSVFLNKPAKRVKSGIGKYVQESGVSVS